MVMELPVTRQEDVRLITSLIEPSYPSNVFTVLLNLRVIMSKALFHLSVVGLNLYTIWYDQSYVDVPFPSEDLERLPLKARGIFLTMWCLAIQTFYFTVALLDDITQKTSSKRIPFIRRIKDTIFCTAFPLASYVSTVFWIIYNIDRELIFPKYLDKTCPSWVNHVIHTAVFVFMIIEMVIASRKYPPKIVGFSMLLFLNFAYVATLVMLYINYGIWAYPLFDVLSWPLRILFFTVNLIICLGVYVLCEKLNDFVWSMQVRLKVHVKNS